MQALSSMLALSLMLGPAPATSDEALAPTSEAQPSPSEPASEASVPPTTGGPLGCRGQTGCLRLTAGSITISTLGVAGIVTGSVLLARPDRVDPEHPIFVTSTRPAGLVTLMLGVGVTLTATLMFIAARRSLRGTQTRAHRLEVTPAGLRF